MPAYYAGLLMQNWPPMPRSDMENNWGIVLSDLHMYIFGISALACLVLFKWMISKPRRLTNKD